MRILVAVFGKVREKPEDCDDVVKSEDTQREVDGTHPGVPAAGTTRQVMPARE